QIEVDAYVNKTKIGIQDTFEYVLEISGESGSNFKFDFPEFENFRNYGVSTSSSTSVSIVNGKMDRKTTTTYKATMRALKTGKLVIPPVSLKLKGKQYTTKAITMDVVDGSLAQVPPSAKQNNQSNQTGSNLISDNVFIQAEIDNKNPFRNQPVIVSYYLYTKLEISSIDFESEPAFNGFWKENMVIPNRFQYQSVNYNGQRFNRIFLRTISLIPIQAGKLEIPSFNLNVSVRTQARSFFDFGGTQNYNITGTPLQIKVNELPPNPPEGFNNAVGTYDLKSSISTQEMKVGDSFTYTLEISGTGNIEHMEIPVLPEINHLRFYDPEVKTEMKKAANKVTGEKIIKYLVVAQEEGDFEIPPLKFSYFDYNQKKYITKTTKSYPIKVLPGEQQAFVMTGISQKAIGIEGNDIAYIINKPDIKVRIVIFDTFYFWLTVVLGLFSIPVSILFANEKAKLISNEDYLRQKQAAKILKKYLDQAAKAAQRRDMEFYVLAQNGLSSYLADKMRIPRGSSTAELFRELKLYNDNEELSEKVINFFRKCDRIRFMPGDNSGESVEDDYKELRNLVVDINKLKKRGKK
ncbi:MAG: BatD family protein, partial [Candidatus Cloacimonetes bacterium]|nr:BatD family protein [Candidatus Cloacimonadota bacterium]